MKPRERFELLLSEVVARHPFYREKFRSSAWQHADLTELPFTTKAELVAEQQAHPPYGRLLTYPLSHYTRLHQTSGTSGTPLRWLDTPESWAWMLANWRTMLAMAGVTREDRLIFPFSFGPFLGFWTAFEAASQMGCLCLAAGGMSSGARLRMLLDNDATVMLCTPTYALHLAEVAREQNLRPQSLRKIIVAGEPGGSIPATRLRIEQAWNARVHDHSGMTEVGPTAIECTAQPGGMHLLDDEFLAEILDPATARPVATGEIGELVLTNLGRLGSPLIRYRTNDLVRVDRAPCPCGSTHLRLSAGILGRTDDMIPIRGNNFYPSALENVVRRFADIAEYRVEVDATQALSELRIEIEPTSTAEPDLSDRLALAIRDELLFRAEVRIVPPGSLPRYEMKAQRVKRK